MKRVSATLRTDQSGTTAIEYGLIAGAVALAVLTAAWTAGDSLRAGLSQLTAALVLETQDSGAAGITFQGRRQRD